MTAQVGIVVFGMIAIISANCRPLHVRKWAPIFGMLSQPFWFYATWHAEQWGIFAISFVYAGSWVMGFYNLWIRRI